MSSLSVKSVRTSTRRLFSDSQRSRVLSMAMPSRPGNSRWVMTTSGAFARSAAARGSRFRLYAVQPQGPKTAMAEAHCSCHWWSSATSKCPGLALWAPRQSPRFHPCPKVDRSPCAPSWLCWAVFPQTRAQRQGLDCVVWNASMSTRCAGSGQNIGLHPQLDLSSDTPRRVAASRVVNMRQLAPTESLRHDWPPERVAMACTENWFRHFIFANSEFLCQLKGANP